MHVEENWNKPDARDLIQPVNVESRVSVTHSKDECVLLDIKAEISHHRNIMSIRGLDGHERKKSINNLFSRLESIHGREKVESAINFNSK